MNKKRILALVIAVLAFAGLSDSIYLAQNETNNLPLLCNLQNLTGCNLVAASQYSRIAGIPIADYGVFFYALVFALAILELIVLGSVLRRALQALSLIGVLVSVYFTCVELFIIHSFCVYCIASALIVLIIFIVSLFAEPILWLARLTPQPVAPPSPPKRLVMPPQ